METTGRGAMTSPSWMSAVLSMPPVYRSESIRPLKAPDGWGGGDESVQSLRGITSPCPNPVRVARLYADGVLLGVEAGRGARGRIRERSGTPLAVRPCGWPG